MPASRAPFIADANVLIDFLETDRSILTLLARSLAPVYVARAVLDKVNQLSAVECDGLGLIVVEATTEELLEAGEGRPGLAFDDVVCLAMARDNGWCCLTNDKALRCACTAAGVELRWGLEVMLDLVAANGLPPDVAIEVATAIQASNPMITKGVLAEFERKAREAQAGVARKGDT